MSEREKSVITRFWENDFVKQTICDLNTAEFPIFLFSPPAIGVCSYIYLDTINSKEGLTERSWEVTWNPKASYPSASTQETFFALLQIAKEQGFPGYVDFGSVYELIKKKRKKDPEGHYKQTLRDLRCLMSIRVIAINSFWSSDERRYRPLVDFGLFDSLVAEIPRDQDELSLHRHTKRREPKLPTAIKMNDIFLASLKENKPLYLSFDPGFFFSLTPIEQRVALVLSKYWKFFGKRGHSRNLRKFAEQIPLFAKKEYHIKQQLKHTFTSLQSKGLSFLKDFFFDKDINGEEKVNFVFTENTDKTAKELIKKYVPEELKRVVAAADPPKFVSNPPKLPTREEFDRYPEYLKNKVLEYVRIDDLE